MCDSLAYPRLSLVFHLHNVSLARELNHEVMMNGQCLKYDPSSLPWRHSRSQAPHEGSQQGKEL